MKKMIVAVTMAIILTTTGLAMAQGWGRGPGMGMGYGPYSGGTGSAGPGPWAVLNLTPEQGQKIQALRENHFKETVPLRNELMSKKFELRSLWLQTNPDEENILAKQKEMNALRAQLQEKATKKRLEMRKILTPEQQAQWQASKANFRYGHGYRRGCGFGPGPGYGRGMGYGPRW